MQTFAVGCGAGFSGDRVDAAAPVVRTLLERGGPAARSRAHVRRTGREGMQVNALRPGFIATGIHQIHGGLEQVERLAAGTVPLGRPGSADEVAQTALWFASDAASYVHGAVIDVAGGR